MGAYVLGEKGGLCFLGVLGDTHKNRALGDTHKNIDTFCLVEH